MTESGSDLGAIRWRCRSRGMLELDTLLTNFFDQQYGHLSPQLQLAFRRLLAQEDQLLYDCFFGHKHLSDSELNEITQCVQSYHQA